MYLIEGIETQSAGRRFLVLNPGGLAVSRAPTVIETLLGSCVSIALWSPTIRVGAMCHYLLPGQNGVESSARYGVGAWSQMCSKLVSHGVDPKQCKAGIFGGGRMFDAERGLGDIGEKNVALARHLLSKNDIPLAVEHVGGDGSRRVSIDLESGEIRVRFLPAPMAA